MKSSAQRQDAVATFGDLQRALDRTEPHARSRTLRRWIVKAKAGIHPMDGFVVCKKAAGSNQRELISVKVDTPELRRLVEQFTEALVRIFSETDASSSALDLTPAEAQALERGGLGPERGGPDARLTAAEEFMKLIRGSFTTAEAARKLRVQESRIRQRVGGDRTLYGFRRGRGWLIPRFQFAGRHVVHGIETVVPHLDKDLHPVAVSRWFTSPDPDLVARDDDEPRSPIAWLHAGGQPGVVAQLAAAL